MTKQKIIFVVVGAINGEPGKYNIIKKLVYHLTKFKIKNVLCLQIEQHTTIENHTKKLSKTINDNQDYIKIYSQYFYNILPLKFKYLNVENRKKLLAEMDALPTSSINPVYFNFINNEIIQELVEHESSKKQLELIEFVTKNQINCIGVDNYYPIKNLLDFPGQNQRIKAMAKNVSSQGINILNGANGVIICEIENIYLLKLCMLISEYCKNSTAHQGHMKMSPLFIHSLYVQDELVDNKRLFEQFSASDPTYNMYAKEQSKIHDFPLIENTINGEFNNDTLTELIGEIIKYLSEFS